MHRVFGVEERFLGADAKVLSPSRGVALAWALQLGLVANPAPPGAAMGRVEPAVAQEGTEATAVDPKPGRTDKTTHLRWGQQEKGGKSHVGSSPSPPSVLRCPCGRQYANIDAGLFLFWQQSGLAARKLKLCKEKNI